ncbi:hypothetical protein SUDANB51_03014 [Streptomyces sp. enrichment culture]
MGRPLDGYRPGPSLMEVAVVEGATRPDPGERFTRVGEVAAARRCPVR